MSMSSPVMTTSWQGALPFDIPGAIGLSRPSSTFCRILFSSASNASSALLAIRIDAAHQRKFGAVVVEAHGRPALLRRPASAPCRHRSARSAGRRRPARRAGAARRGTGENPDTAWCSPASRSFGRTCPVVSIGWTGFGGCGAAFAAQELRGGRHACVCRLALILAAVSTALHRPQSATATRTGPTGRSA